MMTFDEVIRQWMATQGPDEAAEALRSRGVPAERLLTGDRMYDVDQLDARGFYEELEHPLSGRQRYPGLALSRSHRDHCVITSCPSPTLGQHNEEVLGAVGLSEERSRSCVSSRSSVTGC